MILREATGADFRPLVILCKKVWTQLVVPFEVDFKRLHRLRKQGFRFIVLWQDGELLAALGAHHAETDRGSAFIVSPFIVDLARPDRLKLLDALSLYAMNIGLSEGRSVVVSMSDKRVPGGVYGRDFLGMDAQDWGAHIYQIGHGSDMMKRILKRNPKWLLP